MQVGQTDGCQSSQYVYDGKRLHKYKKTVKRASSDSSAHMDSAAAACTTARAVNIAARILEPWFTPLQASFRSVFPFGQSSLC